MSDAAAALDAVAAELARADGFREYYWKLQRARLHESLRVLVEHAPPGRGLRVLDVGSNPPFFISVLAALKYDCTGIDLQPEKMRDAAERYGLAVHKVDIETEPLPFADGTFDVVVFTEVFEHLRINPIHTVSELHRVTKPGGFLLLSTPNLYSVNGLYNLLVRGSAYAVAADSVYDQFNLINGLGFFGHIREYTWQEVRAFLTRIGFAGVTIQFLGGGTKFRLLKPLYWAIPSLKPVAHFIARKGAAG